MSGMKSSSIVATMLLVVACVTPSGSAVPSTPIASGSVPSPSASLAAPTPTPEPTSTSPVAPTPTPTASPAPTSTASPTPAPTPQPQTMIVAYFFLDDVAGGDPALVPVLRTVPKSKATAQAAMKTRPARPGRC